MKRSINSTGRQHITHAMVSFNILRGPTGEAKSFTANLDGLANLKLPATARISIEPYLSHSSMRFDFGTVGIVKNPLDTSLDEIDHGGEINFRIKVTDDGEAGHSGRLLAMGDRLSANPAHDPGQGRLPLLPVKLEALGERVWEISTADGERPYLLLNNRIKGLAARIQDDPLLRGAVLIEAFRKVLAAMLYSDAGGEVAWAEDWKIFLDKELDQPFPDDLDFDDDEERISYIDQSVNAFSDKFLFATKAMPVVAQEDQND
jgi:hypothetical protein